MMTLLVALEENPWPAVVSGIASAIAVCFILWLVLR